MSKHAKDSRYFPEEILLQIFKELPTKSLGKCLCVYKGWNLLIKNSNFISNHLKKSHTNLFLAMTYLPEEGKVGYFLHFDDLQFSEYSRVKFPFHTHHDIVGSCNGLICLVDFKFNYVCKFIFWNPMIGKCIQLPKPYIDWSGPSSVSIGFGFDSETDDYKVLRISKPEFLQSTEVEIYSYTANSWKLLPAPKFALYSNENMVFVNGVLHFFAYERSNTNDSKCLLMGFHVSEESFHKITLPASMILSSDLHLKVHDQFSSIAVIEPSPSRYNRVHVWVMKEYGVSETWTKLFSFERIEPLKRVLGFRINGNLLCRGTENYEHVVSYDHEIKEIQYVGKFIYLSDFRYLESLVLLDQGNEDL